MILFFQTAQKHIIAVQIERQADSEDIEKLCWLFNDARHIEGNTVKGTFVGPRREMITPWSTNAVEITQNMGIKGIVRIEEFMPSEKK